MQQGFILTRQAQDTAKGIDITLWIKTQQGAKQLTISNEKAVFFIQQTDIELSRKILHSAKIYQLEIKPLPLKNFTQQPMAACYFSFMRDFYRAKQCLSSYNVVCYEDDFRPDDRFLMERFITASIDFIGIEQVNKQHAFLHSVKCKSSEKALTDMSLSMVSLDIECSMQGELYSIGLFSDALQCVFMIGEPELSNAFDDKNQPQQDSHTANTDDYIIWVRDEVDLLTNLIAWFQRYDPDIIIGWNVVNFDFQLLQKRCDLHHIAFTISREHTAPYWRKNKTTDHQYCDIAGRVILDGIDLLKTATYSFPSFSLDNVARELLGLRKKVDNVDNRVNEITHNFNHNKTALAAYNLEDCRLVWLIFEKTRLLEFAKLRSQVTGLQLDRSGGSVAAFTNLYLPKLHRSGYVAPNMGDGISGLISPGGYVMDSIPGLYNNVLVLDFKSLYPSIIRTFNIDPMGLIEGLREYTDQENNTAQQPQLSEKPIEGFDGAFFSRHHHFLPDIIKQLWQERDKAKAEKNSPLSQAIKIIMNSFYGVLGSTGCRFFDPRLSGSITKRSHALLKQTKAWIEAQGYTVIYGDTDSIFVHISPDASLTESRALGLHLQTFINDKMTAYIDDNFAVKSYLEIEFETHFSKFFMPTIRGLDIGTKKRYAGLIETLTESPSENVPEVDDPVKANTAPNSYHQQLVFKGLETVRTDWTELAKDFQKTIYEKVFNDLPTAEYISSVVKSLKAGQLDDKLIYRKRIRRRLSDYVKNVPPHVKAARLADLKNKEQGKPLRYQRGGWIEYVITLNGPQVIEYVTAPLDYEFYIERQLLAIADAILPFVGTSFKEITDVQMGLFD